MVSVAGFARCNLFLKMKVLPIELHTDGRNIEIWTQIILAPKARAISKLGDIPVKSVFS